MQKGCFRWGFWGVLFCVREMSCQLCCDGSSGCSGIQLHSKHLSWWILSTSCFPLSSSVGNELRLHASSVISFSTDMKTERRWTEEACLKCCRDLLWLHIIWNAFLMDVWTYHSLCVTVHHVASSYCYTTGTKVIDLLQKMEIMYTFISSVFPCLTVFFLRIFSAFNMLKRWTEDLEVAGSNPHTDR